MIGHLSYVNRLLFNDVCGRARVQVFQTTRLFLTNILLSIRFVDPLSDAVARRASCMSLSNTVSTNNGVFRSDSQGRCQTELVVQQSQEASTAALIRLTRSLDSELVMTASGRLPLAPSIFLVLNTLCQSVQHEDKKVPVCHGYSRSACRHVYRRSCQKEVEL